MCELMEKDVLLEEVAAAIAFIAVRTKNNPQTETFSDELKSCGSIREALLSKSPKDIKAATVREELSALKEAVKDNPVYTDTSISCHTDLPDNTDEIDPSKESLDNIFAYITNFGRIKPCCRTTPQGFVLGGQPGARKAYLTEYIKKELPDTISINGDEYRCWHPYFSVIQKKYGKDSSKITARFAGKVTQELINRCLLNRYNIIIEGTFRTANTPLKTLNDLKEHNYKTFVYIKTCPGEVSWSRCLSRYEIGLNEKEGKERFTDRSHHDLVVKTLPENADTVFKSGLTDRMVVFGVTGEIIFDSQNSGQRNLPSGAIIRELNTANCRS